MNLFEQNNPKLFPELEKQSFDVNQERIEKLKELFPNIVSDGKIDWKTLKLILGDNITEEDERYRFTWNGKTKAIQEVGIPTTSTLRPDKDSSKNWDTTENLYIEGDNLEVLKILQNSYNGKIKMIYIDPPYNGDGDVIYKDDFTLSLEEVEKIEGLSDKKGIFKTVDRLTKNSKDSAKYHTNWLNMMYPRLSIARDLLTDDGVIFVSIDDKEVENLKSICNEIFGETNLIGLLPTIMNLNGNNDSYGFVETHEYTIVYSKNKTKCMLNYLTTDEKELEKWEKDEYGYFKKADTLRRTGQDAAREKRPKGWFPIFITENNFIYATEDNKPLNSKDIIIYPVNDKGEELSWTWGKEKIKNEYYNLIVIDGKNGKNIYKKQRPSIGDTLTKKPKSIFYKSEYSSSTATIKLKELFNKKIFDGPKPVPLLKDFFTIGSWKNSIILDFFSGSGTSAHAIMQLNAEDGGNRKFIMVQVPELSYEGKKDKNGEYIIDEVTGLPEIQKDSEARKAGFNLITEIGKERIRRVGEKILEDNKDKDLSFLDIGFKTFKVDSSNFNEWDTSYEALKKAVEESSEGKFTTYKQDRTDLDLVYEIMLKEGLFLTENIEEIEMNTGTLYKIADGVMYIFLKKLDEKVVKKIIDLKIEAQELFGLDNPTVVLNEAYLDTELKANAKKNFEINGITNIKTL